MWAKYWKKKKISKKIRFKYGYIISFRAKPFINETVKLLKKILEFLLKMKNKISTWERNYINKRFNKYPYDEVVSFIFKNYNNATRNKTKILDLGCGGGNNSYFIAKEGFDLYAIDGSKRVYKINKTKTKFYIIKQKL